MKLNETQIDSVFTCLINGLKDNSKWNQTVYAESIGFLSMKLNKKQLDAVFECIRALCKKSLETISTKLNDKVFSAFIHGLKDEYSWVRGSCARSLGVISKKLNKRKLEKVVNVLMSGLKDKDESVYRSCAESLGVISTNLTNKQLKGVFNALPNEDIYSYFDPYKEALRELLTKWNEKQSERIFNALIFVSKHSINTNNDEDKDSSFVRLLQVISTKLNDKQLYSLVIHLLERAKKKCERGALSEISEENKKFGKHGL
ncbi:PBS lyase HEAT domain protein repeat-containing protein, partial [Reticulomyxa filosa]